MSPPQTKRNELIKSLYSQKWSYASIGRLFKIKRQRVHQIVTGYSTSAIEIKPLNLSEWIDYLKKSKDCEICNQEKEVSVYYIDSNERNNAATNILNVCEDCRETLQN